MTAHWPQLLVLVVWALRFALHCQKSGQPMNLKYNPPAVLLGILLWLAVLYVGGFFAPLGWSTP